MVVQSVGEKLRQARVRKGLQVSDLEVLTGIEGHLILILELDQFELLSEEQCRTYLTRFAEVVGLNSEEIVHQYEHDKSHKPTFDYDHSNDTPISESNLFIGSHRQSRSQRYRQNRKRKWSIFLLILLSLGVLVVGYLYFPVLKDVFKQDNRPDVEKVERPTETAKEEAPTPVAEPPKATITVDNLGDYLTATVSTSQFPVVLDFSLEEADSSWIALTNSNLGESGILLEQVTKTYQTELWEGTTNALLTLGVNQGISVKINGVPVDLSSVEVDSLTYINLVIEEPTNE